MLSIFQGWVHEVPEHLKKCGEQKEDNRGTNGGCHHSEEA